MAYQRPATVTCANCGKTFEVGPLGRVPRFCKPACRTATYDKAKRGDRPSVEERQRLLIWELLQDAGLIPSDKTLPMRKRENAV